MCTRVSRSIQPSRARVHAVHMLCVRYPVVWAACISLTLLRGQSIWPHYEEINVTFFVRTFPILVEKFYCCLLVGKYKWQWSMEMGGMVGSAAEWHCQSCPLNHGRFLFSLSLSTPFLLLLINEIAMWPCSHYYGWGRIAYNALETNKGTETWPQCPAYSLDSINIISIWPMITCLRWPYLGTRRPIYGHDKWDYFVRCQPPFECDGHFPWSRVPEWQ